MLAVVRHAAPVRSVARAAKDNRGRLKVCALPMANRRRRAFPSEVIRTLIRPNLTYQRELSPSTPSRPLERAMLTTHD